DAAGARVSPGGGGLVRSDRAGRHAGGDRAAARPGGSARPFARRNEALPRRSGNRGGRPGAGGAQGLHHLGARPLRSHGARDGRAGRMMRSCLNHSSKVLLDPLQARRAPAQVGKGAVCRQNGHSIGKEKSMGEPVWNKFLSERDKQVFAAAGYATRQGFGHRPAILVVDVNYAFCGDRPEPILESIKRWRNSCGAEAWEGVKAIKRLLAAARARGLPVIYSTGTRRDDDWDRGSWNWKNSRAAERPRTQGSGQDGNTIVPDIAPQLQDIVIEKLKPSVFFGSPLLSFLVLLGADSLIVAGTTKRSPTSKRCRKACSTYPPAARLDCARSAEGRCTRGSTSLARSVIWSIASACDRWPAWPIRSRWPRPPMLSTKSVIWLVT